MGTTVFNGPVTGKNFTPLSVSGGSVNINYGEERSPARRFIPYSRNEELVLRPDLINQLDALLPRTNHFQSAALYGLGGSGKTQLALDYVYRRCQDESCSVFWVHAENETTFKQDYRIIAKVLGIDAGDVSDDEMLEMVRIGIQNQSQWVLVIDSADDLGIFGLESALKRQQTRVNRSNSFQQPQIGGIERRQSWQQLLVPSATTYSSSKFPSRSAAENMEAENMQRYIPTGPGGTVLWTTRDEQVNGHCVHYRRGIHVSRMTVDEAAQLLLGSVPDSVCKTAQNDDVNALLQELQWLPLAISQAGCFIREADMSVSDYLQRLREPRHRWPMLDESHGDRHRRFSVSNSILLAFNISIEYLGRSNHLAYVILHTVAYLDNQNIQWELLRLVAKWHDSDWTDSEADELSLKRAVKRLCDLSFFHRREEIEEHPSFEMHKLVQESVRYRLYSYDCTTSPEDGQQLLSNTVQGDSLAVVDATTQESELQTHFFTCAEVVVGDLFPVYLNIETEKWQQCEKYLAHVTQLSHSVHLCHKNHKISMSLLLDESMTYLMHRGRIREAEALLKTLTGLLGDQYGEDHPKTYEAMEIYAFLCTEQGRYAEAENLQKKVIEAMELSLGKDHPATLSCMIELVRIYCRQQRLAEAEEIVLKVKQGRELVLGDKDEEKTRNTVMLGSIYLLQGDHDKAEREFLEALKHPINSISQTLLLGEARELLASIEFARGNAAVAWEAMSQMYQERLDMMGDTHPLTLMCKQNLGIILHMMGRTSDGLSLVEESLSQCRELLGPDAPGTRKGEELIQRIKEDEKFLLYYRVLKSLKSKHYTANQVGIRVVSLFVILLYLPLIMPPMSSLSMQQRYWESILLSCGIAAWMGKCF